VLKSAKELAGVNTNKKVKPYHGLKKCIEQEMEELPPPLHDKAKQACQLVANSSGFKANVPGTWKPQV